MGSGELEREWITADASGSLYSAAYNEFDDLFVRNVSTNLMIFCVDDQHAPVFGHRNVFWTVERRV